MFALLVALWLQIDCPFETNVCEKAKEKVPVSRGNLMFMCTRLHPSASQKRHSVQSVQTNLKVFKHRRQIAIHDRVICMCGTRLDGDATRLDSRVGSTVGVLMSEIVTKSSTGRPHRSPLHARKLVKLCNFLTMPATERWPCERACHHVLNYSICTMLPNVNGLDRIGLSPFGLRTAKSLWLGQR